MMDHAMGKDMAEQYCFECEKKHYCEPFENIIKNVVLARAYVPIQNMCRLFNYDEALQKGTAFPELVDPHQKW